MVNSELLKKIILRSKIKEIEVKNISLKIIDIESSQFFNSITITYEVTKLPQTYLFSSRDLTEEIESKFEPILKATVKNSWIVVKLKIGDEYLFAHEPRVFASDNILKYIDKQIKSIKKFTFPDLEVDVSNLSYRLDIGPYGTVFLDLYFRTDTKYDYGYFSDPFYPGEVKELSSIDNLFEVFNQYQIVFHPQSS